MDLSSIQKRIERIEKLEQENKVSRDLLKGELENDDAFITANQQAKEALTKKKRIKEEILNRSENKKIAGDIKENNEEIATLKDILSTELIEVYQTNKTDEIKDHTGESRKFKVSVKLLPKRSFARSEE